MWVEEAVFSFGIARMGTPAEGLPQRRLWFGEIRLRGALITVTFILYGEAALAVTCCAELGQLGPRRNRRVSPSAGR